MQTPTSSDETKLAARFASGCRNARSRTLTVDNTVRRITLSAGGWLLYGAATQVFYATRRADAADGTLHSGETAPSSLGAGAAGSPGAGVAWGTGDAATEAASSTLGALALPTDTTLYREISVRGGTFLNLYLEASGSAAPLLEGPFE